MHTGDWHRRNGKLIVHDIHTVLSGSKYDQFAACLLRHGVHEDSTASDGNDDGQFDKTEIVDMAHQYLHEQETESGERQQGLTPSRGHSRDHNRADSGDARHGDWHSGGGEKSANDGSRRQARHSRRAGQDELGTRQGAKGFVGGHEGPWGNESEANGDAMGLIGSNVGHRRGNESVNASKEGARGGDEGTNRGDRGVSGGDEVSTGSNEWSNAGNEVFSAGDEGTRGGNEWSKRGNKGISGSNEGSNGDNKPESSVGNDPASTQIPQAKQNSAKFSPHWHERSVGANEGPEAGLEPGPSGHGGASDQVKPARSGQHGAGGMGRQQSSRPHRQISCDPNCPFTSEAEEWAHNIMWLAEAGHGRASELSAPQIQTELCGTKYEDFGTWLVQQMVGYELDRTPYTQLLIRDAAHKYLHIRSTLLLSASSLNNSGQGIFRMHVGQNTSTRHPSHHAFPERKRQATQSHVTTVMEACDCTNEGHVRALH